MASKKKPQNPRATIQKRIAEQKALMLETLEKVPIIQVACKRLGISRATFYRWKEQDKDFAQAIEKSIKEGTNSMNELAQSKLIELINKGHLTAIIFWLKSRDVSFVDKRKVDFKQEMIMREPIPKEQIDLIHQAMGNFAKKRIEMEEMEAKGILPKYDDVDLDDEEEDIDIED